MLNATQATSIAGAQQYFRTTLSQGDYYLGAEVNGSWHGEAATKLGLKPDTPVTDEQFTALLEGRCPFTGKRLVQRLRKDRRPGVDLTFSVPKSVSLAWAINADERILAALREAVAETITRDVEPLVCRRVRAGDKAATNDRRATGNLIYADFLHKTSRPVDGVVDPHLHIHAFVPNLTFDDGRWYAADLEEVMRQLPALQAKFDARLAGKLKHDLGYAVTATQFRQSRRLKRGWELAGVERSTIEKFSTRTAQIEAYAEEHGVDSAAKKGELGAKTRQKKAPGVGVDRLRERWLDRLTPAEQAAFGALAKRAKGTGSREEGEALRAQEAVRFSLEHHLYRNSTVERHQVIGTALEQGLTLSPEAIEAALASEEGVIDGVQDIRGADRHYVTTTEVLEAERAMIAFARDSRGTRLPIGRTEHVFQREWLNEQQKQAVLHVLASKDTVTAVTGGAGTGKSSLMEEAAEAIRGNRKEVFVFAPSTGAREVLQEKGFVDAQTVEHLLKNDKLHPELKEQVLWIDEAGLLDVRAMNGVFAIAKAQNARVVLSGDTRQHASPRRGEAMRLLETEAGLNIARVEKIQRQQGRYKRAVELISRGHEVVDPKSGLTGMIAGFDLLDRLGNIQEIDGENRHEALAEAYMEASRRGKSTLVVAPTHAEGHKATAEIRDRLRAAGAIGREETDVVQLRSLNLTEAEKSLPSSYEPMPGAPGLIVQFHQNVAGGYTRGARYRVQYDEQNLPFLAPITGGPAKPIPYNVTDRFEVYSQTTLGLARGDRVRFSLGGKAGKRRISNGRLDEVRGFDKAGNLRLKSGMTVPHDYGHLDLGYVVTSHASQGKDRDVAIAAIGKESLPAVNAKQFYVTASRGREDLTLFVDDKAAVRRAIQNAGEQLSATQLTATQRAAAERVRVDRTRRALIERVRDWWRAAFPKSATAMAAPTPERQPPLGPAPGLSRSQPR
ncbi:MobF family relaxase [Botrimarina hoheduenensis]|uniref:Multifunctional conjugation protein TraI n=1 Tax=Botrimarina hoheduenensis TaxID=2528000 RepID=A0A5C5VZF1_9BACT|nr:MobF family relaxase [Botrimarina hoheduenensis]TWT43477.1 Multifunctional conjugation protein TraI [Botrimarina hoheduenensis]